MKNKKVIIITSVVLIALAVISVIIFTMTKKEIKKDNITTTTTTTKAVDSNRISDYFNKVVDSEPLTTIENIQARDIDSKLALKPIDAKDYVYGAEICYGSDKKTFYRGTSKKCKDNRFKIALKEQPKNFKLFNDEEFEQWFNEDSLVIYTENNNYKFFETTTNYYYSTDVSSEDYDLMELFATTFINSNNRLQHRIYGLILRDSNELYYFYSLIENKILFIGEHIRNEYPYISINNNNDSWLVDPINNKVVLHNKYYGDNSDIYKDKDFLIYWLGDSPVKYTIYTKDIIKIIDKADVCYYNELEKVLYCLKDNKIQGYDRFGKLVRESTNMETILTINEEYVSFIKDNKIYIYDINTKEAQDTGITMSNKMKYDYSELDKDSIKYHFDIVSDITTTTDLKTFANEANMINYRIDEDINPKAYIDIQISYDKSINTYSVFFTNKNKPPVPSKQEYQEFIQAELDLENTKKDKYPFYDENADYSEDEEPDEDEEYDGCSDKDLENEKGDHYELSIIRCGDDYPIKKFIVNGHDMLKKGYDSSIETITEYDGFLIVESSYGSTCGPGGTSYSIITYDGEVIKMGDTEKYENNYLNPFIIDSVEFDTETKTIKVEYKMGEQIRYGCDATRGIYETIEYSISKNEPFNYEDEDEDYDNTPKVLKDYYSSNDENKKPELLKKAVCSTIEAEKNAPTGLLFEMKYLGNNKISDIKFVKITSTLYDDYKKEKDICGLFN